MVATAAADTENLAAVPSTVGPPVQSIVGTASADIAGSLRTAAAVVVVCSSYIAAAAPLQRWGIGLETEETALAWRIEEWAARKFAAMVVSVAETAEIAELGYVVAAAEWHVGPFGRSDLA